MTLVDSRIALVTPWPPEASGIADYAYDLAAGLLDRGVSLDIYVQLHEPRPLRGANFVTVAKGSVPDLSGYDIVLHQMGNNTHFHLFMLPIIERFGGVVQLHDMVLHHLMAWQTWMQKDVAGYLKLLYRWYGPTVRKLAKEMMDEKAMPWDSVVVTEIPLFEEVVQHGDCCIVHSQLAKDRVRAALPFIPCVRMPQIYRGLEPLPRKRDSRETRICVLGGVDPQKRVDQVIRAVRNVVDHGLPIRLDIAGAIDERCRGIHQLVRELRLQDIVAIHGRVDLETFNRFLTESDLCVALRNPTMGETSAVVMKAMQVGLALVVSNIGWYAELPSFVIKIPLGERFQEELNRALIDLVRNPGRRAGLREEAAAYARSELRFGETITKYLAVLREARILRNHRLRFGARMQAALAEGVADIGITGESDEEGFLRRLVGACAPVLD